MKMDLIFATHNRHKVSEVQAMLPAGIHVRSLSDLGCDEDIPETGHFIEESVELFGYVLMFAWAAPHAFRALRRRNYLV